MIAGTEWHIFNKLGARRGRVLELQLTGADHAAGIFGDHPRNDAGVLDESPS